MITIAYCIHSLHRAAGMERVVSVKANLLAKTGGYRIYILTANLKGRKPAFELDPAISVIDIGVNEHLRPGKYAAALDKILHEINADICISTGGSEIYALPLCTDSSRKIAEFHFSHDKFLLKYGRNAFGRWYAELRTKKLERAVSKLDCFVTLTERDRQDWERHIGKLTDRVINCCKDNNDSRGNSYVHNSDSVKRERTVIRQIYNPLTFSCTEKASLDGKRAIAIGRLDYQKNFSDLIEAWKIVNGKIPDARLDIYGDGHLRKTLQTLIDELSLSDSVCLKGRTDNVKEELLKSNCMVVSSLFEGFPMVLLESAVCGVPMISYDCPQGPSEIIKDGINGKLVRYRDTGALADAVAEVLSDAELRKSMGIEAKATAAEFAPEIIVSQWDRLFHELLSSKKDYYIQ